MFLHVNENSIYNFKKSIPVHYPIVSHIWIFKNLDWRIGSAIKALFPRYKIAENCLRNRKSRVVIGFVDFLACSQTLSLSLPAKTGRKRRFCCISALMLDYDITAKLNILGYIRVEDLTLHISVRGS